MPLVVAITGASGAPYAVRLLETLLAAKQQVHLTISAAGALVIKQELGLDVDVNDFDLEQLIPDFTGDAHSLVYHNHHNFFAPIASGSFLTSGMVICPCSGGTLSQIAHGSGTNLITRAADVHLKEHRRLVLVPRETPLSLIQLNNMRTACEAGAVILPASPGWYHGVESLSDLIDFVVARILDQLGVPHELMKRWGDTSSKPNDKGNG